jgi:hypothetical protein
LNPTSITHRTHVHTYTQNLSNTQIFQQTQIQTYCGHWIRWRHWVVHSKFFVFGSSLIALPLFGLRLRFGVLDMCFKLLACCLYYLIIVLILLLPHVPRPLARAITLSFCCCPFSQCSGLAVLSSHLLARGCWLIACISMLQPTEARSPPSNLLPPTFVL